MTVIFISSGTLTRPITLSPIIPSQNVTPPPLCRQSKRVWAGSFWSIHHLLQASGVHLARGSALVSEQNILNIGLPTLPIPLQSSYFVFWGQRGPACVFFCLAKVPITLFQVALQRHFELQRANIAWLSRGFQYTSVEVWNVSRCGRPELAFITV